ncbi:MAG: rhamnulokinase [Isosphaeraceae bacterium]
MAASSNYLALDLGAESGRGLLGRFNGSDLVLEEIHRFPNSPVKLLDTLHWDLPSLYREIKTAIQKVAGQDASLDGIGIDTWGVDFGLVGRDNTLLANPVHYRDARTEGIFPVAFNFIPREQIYDVTGLQFLPFNTIYQLLALKQARSPLLDVAESLLMMPDLFAWLLTGERAGEYTDASTTQLLDARQGVWSDKLCQALDLPRGILPPLIKPGSELAPLRGSVIEETGLRQSVTVIVPGTHDTASAVAAVPALSKSSSSLLPDWCYLSSGTWSLLGVELPHPVITAETMRCNFTNEGGVEGTTRLLKNIMGLWLVQECRRTWARAGREMAYEELTTQAQASRPFAALVDPDDSSFLAPGDMPARLAAYCNRTGQTLPPTEGAIVRCCLESLALKYRWTINQLESILGTTIRTIHVVGGGAKNQLLCQFTADACARPVHAGPVEATAIGNILMQAIGRGRLGSITELRSVVARSFPDQVFEPEKTTAWAEASARFDALLTA